MATPSHFRRALWTPRTTTTRATSTTCGLWSSGWQVGNGPTC